MVDQTPKAGVLFVIGVGRVEQAANLTCGPDWIKYGV